MCRDPQTLVQRGVDRTGRGQVYVMGPEHPWKEAATVTQVDRMNSHRVSGLPTLRWLRHLEIGLGWGRGRENTSRMAVSAAKVKRAEGLRGQRGSLELAERQLPWTQQMGAGGKGTSSQTPRCPARQLSLGRTEQQARETM